MYSCRTRPAASSNPTMFENPSRVLVVVSAEAEHREDSSRLVRVVGLQVVRLERAVSVDGELGHTVLGALVHLQFDARLSGCGIHDQGVPHNSEVQETSLHIVTGE